MGTRADFYVGHGKDAEWLGSIAWDGYREGIPPVILHAVNETFYRNAVCAFLAASSSGTTPIRAGRGRGTTAAFPTARIGSLTAKRTMLGDWVAKKSGLCHAVLICRKMTTSCMRASNSKVLRLWRGLICLARNR